jgi:hypothetical protein
MFARGQWYSVRLRDDRDYGGEGELEKGKRRRAASGVEGENGLLQAKLDGALGRFWGA